MIKAVFTIPLKVIIFINLYVKNLKNIYISGKSIGTDFKNGLGVLNRIKLIRVREVIHKILYTRNI